jgi:hypothetical protein
MTLEKWDQKVKPHLQMIEAGALMAARHAKALLARPDFETFAEAELAEARKAVQGALSLIIAAQAHYQSKQLENEI